jgi:hypothetical protein
MREKLRELLQQLHLQGVSEALEQELERAEREAIPVAEVLYRLALEEARVRQEKSLTNRLKQAKIPWDPQYLRQVAGCHRSWRLSFAAVSTPTRCSMPEHLGIAGAASVERLFRSVGGNAQKSPESLASIAACVRLATPILR